MSYIMDQEADEPAPSPMKGADTRELLQAAAADAKAARLDGMQEAVDICQNLARIYRSTGNTEKLSAATSCALDILTAIRKADTHE